MERWREEELAREIIDENVAEKIDVRYLIDEWEGVHRMLAPTPNLFPELSPIDQGIATLSLLSSRREYWEVFICLLGYAQKEEADPNQVLSSIPFSEIWEEDALRSSIQWGSNSFLHYCAIDPGVIKVERETFLPAAYTVGLTLAEGTLVVAADLTYKLTECRVRHKRNCSKEPHEDETCWLDIRSCVYG